MTCAGHVAHKGEKRNVYSILVGKPDGKIPLERPRHRLEEGIKDYSGSEEGQVLVNMVIKLYTDKSTNKMHYRQ
jgi:hypothetical protein